MADNLVVFPPFQATSCTALEMPTSSDILQVILEYTYTDESPTIKGSLPSFLSTIKTFECFYDVLLFVSPSIIKLTSTVKGEYTNSTRTCSVFLPDRVTECRVCLQCAGCGRPAAHHTTEGDV